MKAPFPPLLLLGLLQECLGACYYPNGQEASHDLPCDPDAGVSVCCAIGGWLGLACLENKLCQSPEGKIIRGSCTDPTWRSPDCPQLCLTERCSRAGGHDLVPCANVTGTDTSYCCDGVEDCCDKGVGRMEIQPPNPATWALWVSSSDAYVPLMTLPPHDASTTTTTSTSERAETSTTSTITTGSSSTPTGPASGQSTNDQSGQSTNGDQPTPESSGLSTGAQIGIGVGAAAGAILLAAVAYLWWKFNRLQAKTLAEQGQAPGQYYPAHSYYPQEPYHSELAAEQKQHELYAGGPQFEAVELPAHVGPPPSSYFTESPATGR